MRINSAVLFLALSAGATLAHATSPLPNATYTGINKTLSITGYVPGSYHPAGGGQFVGTLTSGTSTPTTVTTTFWCVDDQEVFDFASSTGITANVTLLKNVAANSSQVRFGNVTNGPANPKWTNRPGKASTIAAIGAPAASALPTSATARYQMAAWLISNYTGFNQTISTGHNAQNDAVQEAIWSLTNNSGYTGGGIYQAGFSNMAGGTGTGTSSVAFWVKEALAHYTSINLNKWAVVSWGALPNGTLGTGRYNLPTGARQTLLVQVAPEPAFYGVLGLGMAGLFFAFRRRKNRLIA